MNNNNFSLPSNKKNACLVLFVLGIAAVVFCLRSSCFSPLNCVIMCSDPATFYMCGKAWYHGYIPYIDIVDVKGPLLFFIFLIGQYITPDDCYGICAIQAFALTITLLGIYYTANILLKDTFASLLTALICLFVIGQSETWGGGGQAEIFIIPFAAWMLYSFIAFLYEPVLTKKSIISVSISSGLGLAASLLIKYNTLLPFLAVILLSFIILVYKSENRRFLKLFLLSTSASFALLIAPFVIWMVIQGNFSHFIHWYFFINTQTYFGSNSSMVDNTGGSVSAIVTYCLTSVKNILRDPVPIVSIIAVISPVYHNRHSKYPLLNSIYLFLLILTFAISSQGLFLYYRIFESVVFVIPAIVMSKCWCKFCGYKAIKVLILAFCITLLWGYNLVNEYRDRTTVDPGYSSAHYRAERLVSEDKYKKVLYWGGLELGYGKKTLLPAIPLWTRHNGSTKEMDEEQIKSIQKAVPDFIFVCPWVEAKNPNLLATSGYQKILDIPNIEKGKPGMTLWQKK